jgi:hypothetical protein
VTEWIPTGYLIKKIPGFSLEHNHVGTRDTNLYRETKSSGLYHPKRFQWIPLAWKPPGCGSQKTFPTRLLAALIEFKLRSALHLDIPCHCGNSSSGKQLPGNASVFVAMSETSRKYWRILSCDTGSFGMYFLTMLNKSNKMQQYADIYLLLNYCTCFGRPSRPSSGVHKIVVAASGTDHTVWGGSFLKRDQTSPYLAAFKEACSPDSMICTRGCNYNFMYSRWWAQWMPKTCRVI